MDTPAISIIIPVYNMEHYLPRMLQSIIDNNFDDIEVICVNDVSTDNSEAVLIDWHNKDNRFKYINNKINLGECPSRNVGLRFAKGKYLMNADPDDEYPQKALQTLYCLAERYSSDMVRGGFLRRDENGNEKSFHLLPKNVDMYINTNFSRCRALQRIPTGHWASLYRAELFKYHLYPEDIYFGCDMIFNVNAYLNAKKLLS